MHIDLRYVTRFVYPTPVWESHNDVRACPQNEERQKLNAYELRVSPAARVLSHMDRWGTRVDSFGIRQAHTELVVTAIAEVETRPADEPTARNVGAINEAYMEQWWPFLQPTRHTRWSPELAEKARVELTDRDDLTDRVRTIEGLVHDRLAYRSGATEVGIDVNRVWDQGLGVCQDFAHLAIALLRSVGIAARYVSGYFYAADPAHVDESVEDEIVVQTHAWVEAAVPGFGWWAIDPTNGGMVGERHIKIGHGRDYDDVTPLRGVYYGDTQHHLAAEVTMSTRSITRRALPVVEAAAQQQQQQQ
jgi:transglutaminase-like putative cysteine protease